MAFRNWPATLRRASYRGVSFFVETDKIETGRRLVIHQFPKRNLPYIEDMGRQANRVSVTAYLVGDGADGDEKSLRSACDRGGAATLVLPMERLKAHCEKCSRNFTKDKLGYVAFDIDFVLEGGAAAPEPAPYLARLTSVAADATAEPLRAAFAASYQATGEAGFVADAATDDVRAAIVAIDALRASLQLEESKAPGVARAVQDAYDNAAALADVGEIGDVWTQTTFKSTAAGSAAAPVVATLLGLVTSIRDAAIDKGAAALELETFAEYGLPASFGGATPSARQASANAAAVASVVRVAALTQRVVALTEIDYVDRRTAIQARADIAEAVEDELNRLTDDAAHSLFVAVSDLRGHAMAYFTRLLTDLAPIVAVSTVVRMPSLWLAYMLYGDAARADELAKRNRVIHASFMPTDIEALGR